MTPKILVIEDEPAISQMYEIVFKDLHHFDFHSAQGGQEGLKKIKEMSPDIVLLDIMMPDMDGYQVLREIHKQKTQDLLVIMLSNLNQDVDRKKAEKLGVYHYLIKSDHTPEELVQKVEEIYQKNKSRK